MIWQTGMDATTAQETVFRSVRSSLTKTSTVTLAAGVALNLETATASADGAFVGAALTATSIINNLFVGMNHAALPADSVGLAQVYGVDTDAMVATAGAAVGAQLIPNIGTLVTVGASTNGNVGVQGAGTILTVLVAPTGATQIASTVFIRGL